MKKLLIILMALLVLQIAASVMVCITGMKKFFHADSASLQSSVAALLSPYMTHVLLLNSIVIISFLSLDIKGCDRFLIGVFPVLTQISLCFYFGK